MEPVTVSVVDVAAQAREMFGDAAEAIVGRPLPANDYRFVSKTPTGGEVTFHATATAAHVVAYLERLEQERVAAGQPGA